MIVRNINAAMFAQIFQMLLDTLPPCQEYSSAGRRRVTALPQPMPAAFTRPGSQPDYTVSEPDYSSYPVDQPGPEPSRDNMRWTPEVTELPCGCVLHKTRMTNWGFYCDTEGQPYCNFECPHENDPDLPIAETLRSHP